MGTESVFVDPVLPKHPKHLQGSDSLVIAASPCRNLPALGILCKVGVVLLGVNAPVLDDVVDTALVVATIAAKVEPGSCIRQS